MCKAFMTFFYFFICLLQTLLAPFITILGQLHPFTRRRLKFEKRNLTDPACRSFFKDQAKASIAFEISSEGELEQIRPLLIKELRNQQKIELIYCSESVENKCQKIYEEYPHLIRLYRLPLLTFSWISIAHFQHIFKFMTADQLVLCRYDLYPELMLYGLCKTKKFILVSATLKNKKIHLIFFKLLYKYLYNQFDLIVCATKGDENKFKKVLHIEQNKLKVYDFRIVQILHRVENAQSVLDTKIFYPMFQEWFMTVAHHQRIIFGSVWPLEMSMFHNHHFIEKIKHNHFKCVLAPHKLNQDFIMKITQMLPPDLPYYIINKEMDINTCRAIFSNMSEKPGILILTVPAILCELYTNAGNAFVGGGHGRSIHSVLEPYVGMCKIFCGPKTHRSTEFDLIKDYSTNQIHVITNLEDFSRIFMDNYLQEVDIMKRKQLFNEFNDNFETVSDQILSKTAKHV
ncbi:MAG: hypothetical protein A2328_07310 [Bdellovibrionales bacterium RIFOXYB2_FULL_36_6]|nr:MAG: hypothetical protein A2328_07310 [Bdellovibrionales bacterium RIFOXYB2_FULL_36_6]